MMSWSVSCSAYQTTTQVPIRFHIVTGLEIEKNGLRLPSWVSVSDIRSVILPEINRIWSPAGIKFLVEDVLISKTLTPPDRDKLVKGIVQAKRDKNGKSDPRRIKNLNKLIDWKNHHPDLINVYYVPYLGETSQGHAKRKRLRVFVGQWSDKASKARSSPEKFQLIEARPFKIGSLSRTTAHELGHILGLKHPDKKEQLIFKRLMGGRKPGYKLTSKEISTARKKALKFHSDN